jgi:Mg2+-importing ATPase
MMEMTHANATNEKSVKEPSRALMSSEEILCLPIDDVLSKLNTSQSGLKSDDVKRGLEIYGYNEVAKREKKATAVEFLLRFKNPLVLILLAAGIISGLSGETRNSLIISAIILMSVVLDFSQETKAERAAEELKERVATTAAVLRDGMKKEVKLSELVPGDVIFLSAGDVIPADARIIDSKDFFVDQSALTGESFPAEKRSLPIEPKCVTTVAEWADYLFMGTSGLSGSATAVIVKTGGNTEYGRLIKRIVERRPETDFERGLRRFDT